MECNRRPLAQGQAEHVRHWSCEVAVTSTTSKCPISPTVVSVRNRAGYRNQSFQQGSDKVSNARPAAAHRATAIQEDCMAKSRKTSVDRRGFLKGAAAGAAALVAKPELGGAQEAAAQNAQNRGVNGSAAEPSQVALARETGARPAESTRVIEHPGSDYMVDVIKSLNIEYLAANPGPTYESLHESLINYGDNKMPEFLTCCHEESAVAMAHGYAKIEGKPMMALIHGDIGLQHAGMAIYNAYCDRVPVFMMVGNHADEAERGAGVQSIHSANDLGSLVRDYTKWDDEPYSLGAFSDSCLRGYKFAMTPPMGPVLIVANNEIQAHPMPAERPRIAKLVMTAPPAGEMAAVAEAAKMLVAAERPLIIAERAVRTEE